MTKTWLYRLYTAEGLLLYVGVSGNPKHRFWNHRHQKTWWPRVARTRLESFPNSSIARSVEAYVIKTERPRYNRPTSEPGHSRAWWERFIRDTERHSANARERVKVAA